MTTYRVLRFNRDDDRDYAVIATGLSLDEAQAHCRRDDTHGEDWFDGYTEDETHGKSVRLDEYVGDNPQPLPVRGGKRNVKRHNKSGDPRVDRTNDNEKSQS